MYEILRENPWLLVIALGMAVPVAGIVFGTVCDYLKKTRLAELDASLKQEMLQRGMSAEEIKMVLEASSTPAGRRAACRRERAESRA